MEIMTKPEIYEDQASNYEDFPETKPHHWKPVISHNRSWRENKNESKPYISFYSRLLNYEEPIVAPENADSSKKWF